MQLEFVTVDVFTERRFGGNPLAVVPNAAGLNGAQMQAIANEFNLSETTFVLPPKDPAHTAEVRIFTPKFEMPFAGHPNVGTAFVVGQRRQAGDSLVFEEKAGLVPLELLREGGAIVGARLTAPQLLKRGEDVAAEIVAEACSIGSQEISILKIINPASLGAARPSSSPRSRRGGRWRRRSLAATSLPGTFRSMALPASISICAMAARSTSAAACSRRCTAWPRTRRPAAPMSRSPDCSRASIPSPICRSTCGSPRESRWAARACSMLRPKSAAAASSRRGSAGAACR